MGNNIFLKKDAAATGKNMSPMIWPFNYNKIFLYRDTSSLFCFWRFGFFLWLIYKVVDWFRKKEFENQYSFNISEINKTKVIITWTKEKLQVWLKEPKEKSFRKPLPLLNTPTTFDSQQVLEKHISSLLAQWIEY